MTNNIPCREELLHHINAVSFAVDEAQLFLDTHPDCCEAMEYFEEMKNERKSALKEYARYYEPLTIDTVCTPAEKWCWINSPWPWQKGGC